MLHNCSFDFYNHEIKSPNQILAAACAFLAQPRKKLREKRNVQLTIKSKTNNSICVLNALEFKRGTDLKPVSSNSSTEIRNAKQIANALI